MDRLAIARTLSETAGLLALTGQEPFRARAYERGAQVLPGDRVGRASTRGW